MSECSGQPQSNSRSLSWITSLGQDFMDNERINKNVIESDVVSITGQYGKTNQNFIIDTGAKISLMSMTKYYELKEMEKGTRHPKERLIESMNYL